MSITQYVLVAAGVTIALLSGLLYFMNGQNNDLREALATERANVVALKASISDQEGVIQDLQDQRDQDNERIIELSIAANDATQKKDRAIADLNAYRDRLSKTAVARPGLVGRLATRATCRVQRDFFLASGGDEQDSPDCSVSSSASVPNH